MRSPRVRPFHRRPQRIRLSASTDYTQVLTFENLLPDTDYTVRAVFGDVSPVTVSGRFHTLGKPPSGAARDFSFLLSSCNLTVVSISNGLAYLLSMAGTLAALSSLKTPPERWRYVPFVWLRRLIVPSLVAYKSDGFVRWQTHRGETAIAPFSPESLPQACGGL